MPYLTALALILKKKKRKTELMLIEGWEGQRKQKRHKAIVPLF